MSDEAVIRYTAQWITLDVLLQKGLISYADIQESIAAARERIPRDKHSPAVADALNIMEQTYQSGAYQSPRAAPGDPDH